jgi:hypothetical protein
MISLSLAVSFKPFSDSSPREQFFYNPVRFLVRLGGELFPRFGRRLVTTEDHFEPVPNQEAQERDFLIDQPLVLRERMALARLGEGKLSAPSVWVVARRRSCLFDISVLLIRQSKRDILRPLRFTHFVSPSSKENGCSARPLC